MENLEAVGQVVNTDVLVVGGGAAGLPAAIQAKEKGNDSSQNLYRLKNINSGFKKKIIIRENPEIKRTMNWNWPDYAADGGKI